MRCIVSSLSLQEHTTRLVFSCVFFFVTQVWEIWPSDMNPIPVLELFDLETPVQALAIDGAGKALAAGGEDGMVAVWDLATGGLSAT
ncbi:unnamed protein product [Scytosiphon promiscuus]